MATHEVDRKILSRLARDAKGETPELSRALYQILGLSKMLSRRLLRARKLRRLEPSDEKAMTLYYHIIWMAREGLDLVEKVVVPYADSGRHGILLTIFTYKLRASFYHVFCLFHNNPPASPLNPAWDASKGKPDLTTLLPLPANKQARMQPEYRYSMFSDSSNVSNPYGSMPAISPPPGLPGKDKAAGPAATFLFMYMNFIPIALNAFESASALAAETLSGSAPLRLSIALEFSAFYWDCLDDRQASRKLARRTIRGVYAAQEGMDDTEFEDAAILVGTLGRMMRRKSEEQTPKMAPESPATTAVVEQATAIADGPPPVPPIPRISVQEHQALTQEFQREQTSAQNDDLTPTPSRPRTAEEDLINKPLPDLPHQEGAFMIPRRPVGTPPHARSRSTSRPRTAESQEEPASVPRPLFVPRTTAAAASPSPSRSAIPARSGNDATKPSMIPTMIPRPHMKNA